MLVLAGAIPLMVLGRSPGAEAHGVSVQHRSGVEIEARYDTGSPMGNAQVAVFAPEQPETPVMTGTTDDDGTFWFVPPAEHPTGIWEVQVRLAGHGALLQVPVGADRGSAGPVASLTPLQRGLMGAIGIWGFVGTALFFSRRAAPISVASSAPPAAPPAPLPSSLTDDSHAHS